MTSPLKAVSPKNMDPDSLLEWSKHMASEAGKQCSEASEYFDSMRRHYGNLTKLLERFQSLRNEQGERWMEEAKEIVETALEVREAMDALVLERLADHTSLPTLEDDERELLDSPSGANAARELERETRAFLLAYNRHKARLGLKTQEDVARLTGLNRRYISNIERGAHKPQFRTIKRLADAFCVDVTDLMLEPEGGGA